MTDRLLPFTGDVDTAPFFEAATERRLVLLFCTECDKPLHLPRPYCYDCGQFSTEWREVDGSATVYCTSVVERSYSPGIDAPYTLIVVDLAAWPGVHFVTNLPGRQELPTAAPLQLTFEEVGVGVVLPRWLCAE